MTANESATNGQDTAIAATDLQDAALAASNQGAETAIAGADALGAAKELADIGRAAVAVGASDLTRGMDKVIVAEGMATLGQVAAAGAADVAQGAEMLATSEDIAVMSAIVRALSAKDLDRGLETARIAGEFAAVGDLGRRMGMPVLAAFLIDRSSKLRGIGVENLLRYSGTRALSEAMARAGARVSDLGAGEVAEGVTPLAVAGHRPGGARSCRRRAPCRLRSALSSWVRPRRSRRPPGRPRWRASARSPRAPPRWQPPTRLEPRPGSWIPRAHQNNAAGTDAAVQLEIGLCGAQSLKPYVSSRR